MKIYHKYVQIKKKQMLNILCKERAQVFNRVHRIRAQIPVRLTGLAVSHESHDTVSKRVFPVQCPSLLVRAQ